MYRTALLISVLLVAGCASSGKEDDRTETLDQFEAVVRWNQFDSLVDFMHPDWLAEHPVDDLDLRRLKQFRVSQYQVMQVLSHPDGMGLDRLIRLHLYNLHTARERVVEYMETWRWDAERERWMLHSGLPDPTRGS